MTMMDGNQGRKIWDEGEAKVTISDERQKQSCRKEGKQGSAKGMELEDSMEEELQGSKKKKLNMTKKGLLNLKKMMMMKMT